MMECAVRVAASLLPDSSLVLEKMKQDLDEVNMVISRVRLAQTLSSRRLS
jgi:hypothetical protein